MIPLLIHVKGPSIAQQVHALKLDVYAVDSGAFEQSKRSDKIGMAVGNASAVDYFPLRTRLQVPGSTSAFVAKVQSDSDARGF